MERRQFITLAAGSLAAGASVAEMGVNDREILLGQTAVFSGQLGGPTKEFTAGAQLAFAAANAAGTLGRQIKLISLDDELKPDLAVANYQRLLEEHKVFVFFGSVGSGPTAAGAGILKSSGVPLLGCYSVADSAREKVRGLAYSVRASSGRESQRVVQHLQTIGIKRIGAVGLDTPGGKEATALIERAVQAEGLTLVHKTNVKPDGSNMADAAMAMAKAEPQAVVMYLTGPLPGSFVAGVRKAGSASVFYGLSIVQGPALAKALGAEARGIAISQVMPFPWNQADPDVRLYTKLADQSQLEVNYTTFEGYVNGRVMIDVLARAGRELTRAKFMSALRTLKTRIAGMDIDFTDPQAISGSRFTELVQVTLNGRYVR